MIGQFPPYKKRPVWYALSKMISRFFQYFIKIFYTKKDLAQPKSFLSLTV